METRTLADVHPRRATVTALAGTAAFVAIFAASIDWAKWTPYLHKLETLRGTHSWSGGDILATAGDARGAPSLQGAWAFTTAYVHAVWPAVVAALLIAAALETLVPRRWLLQLLTGRTTARGSLAGGLLALPSLMCTCCAAPVAATLRRSGAPTSAVLAYWLGNPVLNPAVLAFLALVAPWQWLATRIVAGVVLVFAVSTLVARLAREDECNHRRDLPTDPSYRLADTPRLYALALTRLSATLLPEYALVVFLLGLFRGWLFPFDADASHWGTAVAILAAATLGALVVLPTAGEIPIIQALALAGASAGVQGALLISLPAISLASIAMVVRELSTRVTLAAAAGVCATAVAAGLLSTLIT